MYDTVSRCIYVSVFAYMNDTVFMYLCVYLCICMIIVFDVFVWVCFVICMILFFDVFVCVCVCLYKWSTLRIG